MSESKFVSEVSDSNWEAEVIEASKTKPVFVDFWAEWCMPCKMFGPIVDKVADEMNDKIKFTKMDVDANSEIPQKFGIMSIPTSMVFINGEPAIQQSGALPENMLREMLNSVKDQS
jgi:thioredoxin 1